MTTGTNPNPGIQLKTVLNQLNPEQLADAMRLIGLGSILRDQIPQSLRKQTPAADPNQLATLASVNVVANKAPAASILRARAWRGTATPAELAIQPYGTTPGSGQIAVAPNGDIVTLAADAWLDIDVTYLPERGYTMTLPPLPVVGGVLTLPVSVLDASGFRTAILLMNAVVTAGTLQGTKIVVIPAGTQGTPSLPATTKACLSLDGLTVQFNNVTDAPSQAQVTLLVVTDKNLDALLEANSTLL